MSFNQTEHLIKLSGKDYLETKWRIVWFRDDNADGSIQTELLHYEDGFALAKATILIDGKVVSTGIASADSRIKKAMWVGKEIMKAETAAIGRALAHAGYGTQFTGEEEGDHLADSPVKRGTKPATQNGTNALQPPATKEKQNNEPTDHKPWAKADYDLLDTSVEQRFPMSFDKVANMMKHRKIGGWHELGTLADASKQICSYLYEQCTSVKVERMRHTGKYLEFSVDETAALHPKIQAYARSSTIKNEWLGEFAYHMLGWDNYDDKKTHNQWVDIDAVIVIHYERNDHGTLIATGIGHNIEDPDKVDF